MKNPGAQRSKAVARVGAASPGGCCSSAARPMENRVDEFKVLVGYLQPAVAATVGSIDGVAGAAGVPPFGRARLPAPQPAGRAARAARAHRDDDWVPLGADEQALYAQAVAAGNIMLMRRAAFSGGTPERSPKVDRLVDILTRAARTAGRRWCSRSSST